MRFTYWHMVFIIPFFFIASAVILNAGDDILAKNGNGYVDLSEDSLIFITDYRNSNINITSEAAQLRDDADWYQTEEGNRSKSIVDYSLQYLENKNSGTSYQNVISSFTKIDDWAFRTLGLEDETWKNVKVGITIFMSLVIAGILFYLIFGK